MFPMQIFTGHQRALVCFLLSLLFVITGFCYGDHRTIEVVGLGECADCKENNIMTSQAFSGLCVTVECKSANGHFKTRGAGDLDENGNFKVSLPDDFIKDDELREECYAQLHSASAAPCPAHGGLDNSKIVIKPKSGGKHTLEPAGKLRFSSVICTSAFFWHYFKHPLFPKLHHPHLPFPPPPAPVYKKPLSPPVPIYKKPLPPPVPIVKKPCPPKIKKPLRPPVPIVKNPSPPKVKKPFPPPTPVYKPLPPTVPIHKPPFFKPLPPCPPRPKIPPKYFFHHPKFSKWSPFPPFSPHS